MMGINYWRDAIVLPRYARTETLPYVLTAAQERALKPGDSFKECPRDCAEMIVIPAGSFVMGAPEPRYASQIPQHAVTVPKSFAVAKYEVTFADWDACVKGGGCNDWTWQPIDSGWGRGKRPVIYASWHDAQQYLAWLARVTGKSYRLLSEAEYEYVARAGTTTIYPWGDDVQLNGTVMANCDGCGSEWDNTQTAPVGSFLPNKFGLYDMVGNIWEWTEDCWHDNYKGAPANGSAWTVGGDCSQRIARGGSWRDTPDGLRSAMRSRLPSFYRYNGLGFRVARTLLAP
jgi:formylglycine-generating enzyme required for sulfatase activity